MLIFIKMLHISWFAYRTSMMVQSFVTTPVLKQVENGNTYGFWMSGHVYELKVKFSIASYQSAHFRIRMVLRQRPLHRLLLNIEPRTFLVIIKRYFPHSPFIHGIINTGVQTDSRCVSYYAYGSEQLLLYYVIGMFVKHV